MGIQLPRSFQGYKEEYTEICAWSTRTTFSVFPPPGDERNTVGEKKKNILKNWLNVKTCQCYCAL